MSGQSAVKTLAEILANGPAMRPSCPACGYPCYGFRKHGPPSGMIPTSVCPECGHICKVEEGAAVVLRNMTRQEKAELSTHPRRDMIKRFQEEVVERLIG